MNNYPFAFDEIFDIDLTGKFVVTGLFTSMRRSDVVHYIYTHGGSVLSAPTRATDYLIVGGEKSKTWKYGQYGTKIRKGLDLREKDEKILDYLRRRLHEMHRRIRQCLLMYVLNRRDYLKRLFH